MSLRYSTNLNLGVTFQSRKRDLHIQIQHKTMRITSYAYIGTRKTHATRNLPFPGLKAFSAPNFQIIKELITIYFLTHSLIILLTFFENDIIKRNWETYKIRISNKFRKPIMCMLLTLRGKIQCIIAVPPMQSKDLLANKHTWV